MGSPGVLHACAHRVYMYSDVELLLYIANIEVAYMYMLTQVMQAAADKHTKQLQYDKARKQKAAYQKRRYSA